MSQQAITSKISNSRGLTLALGIGAALLAAILLLVYLNRYRSSVDAENAATPVLVAKNLIPKGTSGTIIAKQQLFQVASLPKNDLKVGAISDPAYLNGRVAAGGHLPRPAGHDGRPERHDHRGGSDEPHRRRARGRDPGRRCSRSRRLHHAGRPRRRLRVARGRRRQPAHAPRTGRRDHAGTGRRPVVDVRAEGQCPARTEARVRVGQRYALVPAAAGRRREEDAGDDRHDADAARTGEPQQDSQVGEALSAPNHPSARRRRRPRHLRRATGPARRPGLPAAGNDGRRRRDGAHAPDS